MRSMLVLPGKVFAKESIWHNLKKAVRVVCGGVVAICLLCSLCSTPIVHSQGGLLD